MGRQNFGLGNIKRHTYVCEDHFPEGADLDYRTVSYVYLSLVAQNDGSRKYEQRYPCTAKQLENDSCSHCYYALYLHIDLHYLSSRALLEHEKACRCHRLGKAEEVLMLR